MRLTFLIRSGNGLWHRDNVFSSMKFLSGSLKDQVYIVILWALIALFQVWKLFMGCLICFDVQLILSRVWLHDGVLDAYIGLLFSQLWRFWGQLSQYLYTSTGYKYILTVGICFCIPLWIVLFGTIGTVLFIILLFDDYEKSYHYVTLS